MIPRRTGSDRPTGAGVAGDAPLPWLVVAATTVAVFGLLFSATLEQPYHLDTTAYFAGLRDWRDGRLTCPFATRCMVSYWLIPFSAFGEQAVRVGFVAAAALFFLFSYRFLSRALSPCAAYVGTLLVLATPAAVINVTHMKEDLVGLMFLAAAAGLAMDKSVVARLSSAVAFACALLAKETFLMFAPFYASILAHSIFLADDTAPARALREPRRWLLLAAALGVALTLTLIGKPDYVAELAWMTGSPHTGQFRGPFSPLLPAGFAMFERGIGLPVVFWFQLAGLVALLVERDWRRRIVLAILAASALLLAFFLMNITVMTYRHFVAVAFLSLPLATYALERVVGRRWVYVFGALFVLALVFRSYPFVAFHKQYNPQQQLFASLRDMVGPGDVVVTMDYAGLARHYLGVTTKQHAPDPDAAAAATFLQSIRDDAGRAHYMLPDALAYDARGAFRTELAKTFDLEPVREVWFEDFHTLDYGRKPDELATELARKTGCDVTWENDGTETVGTVELDRYRYRTTCGVAARDTTSLGYRGTVFPYLARLPIHRLAPRAAD